MKIKLFNRFDLFLEHWPVLEAEAKGAHEIVITKHASIEAFLVYFSL
jgi:hypothetical protein